MSALAYYDEERARHPDLQALVLSRDEAREMVRRAMRWVGGRGAFQPTVAFTSGRRLSRAGSGLVTLNADHLSALLVAHECGHELDVRARHPLGRRIWHGKRHRRIVDRLARWMRREGLESVIARVARRAETVARREARAACPPSLDDRIARRVEQCARLERRIRSLTTRLRTARRSLVALERRRP